MSPCAFPQDIDDFPQDIQLTRHAPLADYTTFRLGGPCTGMLHVATPAQLHQAVSWLHQHHLPFLLIGGGSNLVVADQGIDCAVICYVSKVPLIERQGNELIVSASTALDACAAFAVKNGLEGLTMASGIPGTVGGAIVGNAGAFGRQIGDCVNNVTLMSLNGTQRKVPGDKLEFTYRHSCLKNSQDIVVDVRLSLTPANATTLEQQRHDILELRHKKHPNLTTHPCAGSFFRNIEPSSAAGRRQAAGWFLEQADAKSLHVGGAAIFKKHANIIVNTGSARATDVVKLSQRMQQRVQEKFNLTLKREVRFVGNLPGHPGTSLIW